VARLLTSPTLRQSIHDTFEAARWHGFQLHPPVLRALGWKRKLKFGPWLATPLAVMAKMKFLRGTALDPFRWMGHRRQERALIHWYRDLASRAAALWTPERHQEIVALLALPDQIRGYDEIKVRSAEKVQAEAQRRLTALNASEKTEAVPTGA